METIYLKIKRCDKREGPVYWEEFEIPYRPRMNIISVLMEIQRNPQNVQGDTTAPVAWEQSCLEEVCGACSMVINGRVRQACSALIDDLDQPITLEPMSKFPTIRDLVVDRSGMFESLKKIHGWITLDGSYDLGPGPVVSPKEQEIAYDYSRCMTCGCCVEACPQVNEKSKFMGAFAVAQADLFNRHPSGKMEEGKRLDAMIQEGGIVDCGNAQNCEAVCPKEIPLTRAIANIGAASTKHAWKKFFKG